MPNFIVSYDLNGPRPSHREMDQHLSQVAGHYGRVLETVWYVGTTTLSHVSLRDYVAEILGPEDQLLVVECLEAAWQNLLITDLSLRETWEIYR